MKPSELPCDLMDIGDAAVNCEEDFSGLGFRVYVAYPEDLNSVPDFDEGKAAFPAEAFTFKEGRGAWRINIKKRSAHIDSTGNEGAGYSMVGTFVIDKDLENAAVVLRKLKNRGDAIFFFERLDGTYSVIYDKFAGTEIKNSFATGAQPSDEHGQTVTVTCNPCRYSDIRWTGSITLKSAAVIP